MTFLKLRTQYVYFSTFYKNVQINNEKMILSLVWVSAFVYVNFGVGFTTNSHKLNDLHRTQIHYLTLTQVRNLGGLG